MSLIRPSVIWATNSQFDTTSDGRTLKMLNVIDEFTREAAATGMVIGSHSAHQCANRFASRVLTSLVDHRPFESRGAVTSSRPTLLDACAAPHNENQLWVRRSTTIGS